MAYKYEKELLTKAEEFSLKLKSSNIVANLLSDTIREYSIKLEISKDGSSFGKIEIFIKPSKNSFTLVDREIKDENIKNLLQDLWHGVDSKPQKGINIYADGSFLNGVIGYGAVIIKDGIVVKELSGTINDELLLSSHQIAGEVTAVTEALKCCTANDIKDVSIFYDYAGLEKWAKNEWKSDKGFIIEYKNIVQNCGIKITWNKVLAHSGNRWNELADKLAKKGATSLEKKQVENSFTLNLEAYALSFIENLAINGIEAKFTGIINSQFARIEIIQDNKKSGIFDLYNTPKKPFSPYIHNFKDKEVQEKVSNLWQNFKQSN